MQKRKWHLSLPFIAICFTFGFFVLPGAIGIILLLLRKRAKRAFRVKLDVSGVDESLSNYQLKNNLMNEIEVMKKEKEELEAYLHSLENTKNIADLKVNLTDTVSALEIKKEALEIELEGLKHSKIIATNTNNEVEESLDKELTIKLDNGLYPGELILLNWYKNRLTTDLPPQYLFSTYGLDDNESDCVKNLLSNGFLRISNTVESLKLLKVNELKEILKSYNLKVSGKKQELIERLIENLTEEDLEKIAVRKSYILTEKGEQTLEEYKDLLEAHQYDSKDKAIKVVSFLQDYHSSKN